MASRITQRGEFNSFIYITCVLIVASSSVLPTRSFCLIWAPSSLGCRTLEPLLGVSALVCPLVGVEGGWPVLRGLILTALVWIGVWGLRRRLGLRGLSATGEAGGRSVRNFLRGVRLMPEAAADAVCFRLVGVDTSWKKSLQKIYTYYPQLLYFKHRRSSFDPTVWRKWDYSKSYAVLLCLGGLLALRFFLWFCQRAQIFLR